MAEKVTPHSRICGKCGVKWPLGFAQCPTCLKPTKVLIGIKPDRTREEAVYANKSRDFAAFYAEHEQRRIAAGNLAPEELGKQEARRLIDLERQLSGD